MKHNNTYFLELTRTIFTKEYSNLSNGAKWLFVVLNELEQRYTTGNPESREDFFFRTDEELAKDANISITTLKRYKAELKETDLVRIWQTHFVYKKGEKRQRSEKHVTAYKILK